MRPRPVAARLVPVEVPAKRCCATGCGDKIKGDTDVDLMYEVTFDDGSISYVEKNGSCEEWFVAGHPDYGHPYGWCPGLPPALQRIAAEEARR
jgi:hypothetical protein